MNNEFLIPKTTEGLQNLPEDFIFPSHFLMVLLGKPGSGKTFLVKHLLKSEKLFFRKFDFVLVVSPSISEYAELFITKSNLTDELSFEWIEAKINEINKNNIKGRYLNVLLILDDVVCDLKSESYNKKLIKLIFNRRHLINNGMLSIIAISQKYKSLPTSFRVMTSVLVTFQLSPSEFEVIEKELVYSSLNFEKIANRIFLENKKDFLIYNINSNKIYQEFSEI